MAIVQESLRQYRIAFFERLRDRLATDGVELMLVYGEPLPLEASKGDLADLRWGKKIQNRYLRVGTKYLTWQPCLREISDADLVVVEQASRHVVNYLLVLQGLVGTRKVAFWGHGRNLQESRVNPAAEVGKVFLSRRAHWWFAYNDFSANTVQGLGYPASRITSVQNAIDTRQLTDWLSSISRDEVKAARQEVGIRGQNVCLFAGSLYAEKGLDYLLLACDQITTHVADFELVVIGDGPGRAHLEGCIERRPWLHVVGAKFDRDKVPYFAMSKLLLLPGAVGLAVLDAFALETPCVSVNRSDHGPEVAYLESGYNGLLLDRTATPSDYARAVIELLEDDDARLRLIDGCRESRRAYTVDKMVERFASGVMAALDTPPAHGITSCYG